MDLTIGSFLPGTNTFTIGQGFVEDISRTTKDMEVMEALRRPSSTSEYVVWRQTSGWRGQVIVEVSGMADGHGPPLRVNDIRPVNGCMDEHCASRGYDGTDGTFCDAVVMMSTNTCEMLNLAKMRQVTSKVF